MAKIITRKLLTPYGDQGPTTNFSVWGSKKAGTPQKVKDILQIQSLTAWRNGIQDVLTAGNKALYLEDLNGLLLVYGYMMSYLFQEGVPEWDNGQTYFVGALCRKPGTNEIYQSLQDDNLGNALPAKTNNTFWMWFNEPPIKAGMGVQFYGNSLPQGRWMWCDGSAVSRAAFADLFAAIGTSFGAGNGTTTFQLPDNRGRTPMGAGAGSGLTVRSLGALLGTETHDHDMTHKHKTTSMYNPGNTGRLIDIGNIFGLSGTHNGGAGATFGGTAGIDGGYNYQLTDNPEGSGRVGSASSIQPSIVCNFIIAY